MRLRLIVPLWLRENPGLVLTSLYVFASLVGVLYHFLFFRRFGVNVLEFSEASDFLMVVVREPLTVALALLGVPFYLVYVALTTPLSRLGQAQFFRVAQSPRGTPEVLCSQAPLVAVDAGRLHHRLCRPVRDVLLPVARFEYPGRPLPEGHGRIQDGLAAG